MLFYSNGTERNVLMTLDYLEVAVILLSKPSAALDPDFDKRHAWARFVSEAMQTRGKIHLIVIADKGDASLHGFRGPLNALPEPYRARTMAALAAIAAMFIHAPFTERLDCIGENATP